MLLFKSDDWGKGGCFRVLHLHSGEPYLAERADMEVRPVEVVRASDWADAAADAVLDDLRGRRGIGDEIDALREDDVFQEMRSAIADIIRAAAP